MSIPLRVLVCDDELMARKRVLRLLTELPGIEATFECESGEQVLAKLREEDVDVAILDINMPGLSGLETVMQMPEDRPYVIFLTAHPEHAVQAFDVGAVDYLLKPIRSDRLDEAVRRVAATRTPELARAATDDREQDLDVIPAEIGGVTHLVRRDTIGWVEAEGDYSRLHSASGAHLVRIPLSTLETRWAEAGFQRVHRSYLVSLPMVIGMRSTGSAVLVRLRANGASPAAELPVSRRQVRELRDRLVRDPMRGYRSVRGDE